MTLMVRELRRVTLLWDELWAGALAQHQPEAARRLGALATELQKVAERETLTELERNAIAGDKYNIAVRPVSDWGRGGQDWGLDGSGSR